MAPVKTIHFFAVANFLAVFIFGYTGKSAESMPKRTHEAGQECSSESKARKRGRSTTACRSSNDSLGIADAGVSSCAPAGVRPPSVDFSCVIPSTSSAASPPALRRTRVEPPWGDLDLPNWMLQTSVAGREWWTEERRKAFKDIQRLLPEFNNFATGYYEGGSERPRTPAARAARENALYDQQKKLLNQYHKGLLDQRRDFHEYAYAKLHTWTMWAIKYILELA